MWGDRYGPTIPVTWIVGDWESVSSGFSESEGDGALNINHV
jgi:hypothetical protein